MCTCKRCDRPIRLGDKITNNGTVFYHEECPPKDIVEYFAYKHLPEHLQSVSMPFAELATSISEMEGDPREKAAALRKLLEAKDAAVRATL